MLLNTNKWTQIKFSQWNVIIIRFEYSAPHGMHSRINKKKQQQSIYRDYGNAYKRVTHRLLYGVYALVEWIVNYPAISMRATRANFRMEGFVLFVFFFFFSHIYCFPFSNRNMISIACDQVLKKKLIRR